MRKPLVVMIPEKPVNEMTDAEREALAAKLVEQLDAALSKAREQAPQE